MKLSNVRSFLRAGYLTETEPIRVLRSLGLVGTWYPAGTEPEEGAERVRHQAPVTPAPTRAMPQADPSPVRAKAPAAPVLPVGKHQTQEEFDAGRTRDKALDDARRAKQKRDAEWSRKAQKGGSTDGRG